MAYLVTYIPSDNSQSNEPLMVTLKQYENWAILGSNTFVVINRGWNSVQIRDDLKQHMRVGDKLIVTKSAGEAAWKGFTDAMSDWLQRNL